MVSIPKIAVLIFACLSLSSSVSAQQNPVILNYHTLIKIEKGKLIKEKIIEIQVHNKQSDWVAEIEIEYSEHNEPEIQEAYITNPNGVIVRKLKKKDIITKSEVSAGTFFENNFVQEFELKWHEYPYTIKYAYRTTIDQYLYIARWFPFLYKDVPVVNASLQVQVPVDMPIYMNYTDTMHYTSTPMVDYIWHTWKSSYTKQIKSGEFDMNIMDQLPNVSIVPKDFTYAKSGSLESWASFGNWQSEIISGLDELPKSEQLVVDQLIRNETDKREIIKKLYWICNKKLDKLLSPVFI